MIKGFRSPAKILRRLKLTPLAARYVSSWPRFMINYAFGLVPEAPYVFRNGARLQIGRGVDHVPIIEIILKQDYGCVGDDLVIVDIGAHIGTFTVYAACANKRVAIYSYEPMPGFFSLLEQNVRLNKAWDRVKCFNLAVGATVGTRKLVTESDKFLFPTFVSPASGDLSASNEIEADCTSLGQIIETHDLAHIDLLKMDCEGAEYEIFYNTSPKYLSKIREIRMEYHELPGDGRNVTALTSYLERNGFEITRLLPTPGTQANGSLWACKHG